MEKPFVPEKKLETEKYNPEQIVGMGDRALGSEADLKIPIHRRRGFMLATFLALGMTMFAGQAEARGRNIGRRMAREAVTDIFAGARHGIDMAHNQKILEVNAWYDGENAKITEAGGALDNTYNQKKQELKEKQDYEALSKLEEWYQHEKNNLRLERARLRREREVKLAGIRIRRDGIRRGVGIFRSVVRGRI